MAEGFELVRTVRQHLRRSAALLEEGDFDGAFAEVEAALALDQQSLPAQALRDRIQLAKAAPKSPATRPAPAPDHAQTPRSFVPHGVNAASWRGFEQRITERRFKALLDTINTSIVAGNPAAARLALDEARELRPDASELAEFETRVSAVPAPPPLPEAPATRRIWMRAMGAAALFLVGVSMLLGLEWMRPSETSVPIPPTAPAPAAVTPTQDRRPPVPAPDLSAVPVAMNEDDDSVPAIVVPPEPLLRPRATTGTALPELTARSVVVREAAPPPVERTLERREIGEDEDPPLRPLGEVSDEYVAAATPRTAAITPDATRSVVPPSRSSDTPVNADVRGRSTQPAASVASAVVIPGIAEQGRVEEVLRRYARAYGSLDASAARAVWPSVDERALARAFQNLSSQNVSFDDCEIDIRGVIANASCRGQASYAPKVGNREPRTESRTWRFELRRDGDAWKIENAEARRQSTAEFRDQ